MNILRSGSSNAGSISSSPLSFSSIDTQLAFSPSPPAALAASASFDESSFLGGAECPLSSRCLSLEQEGVQDHLVVSHNMQHHHMEVDEAGVGIVQMDTDVHIREGPPRRSGVLVHFDGAVFCWTVESRRRADTETQASVTLQLLYAPPLVTSPSVMMMRTFPLAASVEAVFRQQDEDGMFADDIGPSQQAATSSGSTSMLMSTMPASTSSAHSMLMSTYFGSNSAGSVNGGVASSSASQAGSTPRVPSSPMGMSRGQAESLPRSRSGSASWDVAMNHGARSRSGSSSNYAMCAPSEPRYMVRIAVLPAVAVEAAAAAAANSNSNAVANTRCEPVLLWEGTLFDNRRCLRHERLVSRGQSLVALFPTHRQAFTVTREADVLQMTVETRIQRVAPVS